MKLFCINMRGASERRAHCERHFAERGVSVAFIEGFPARQCSVRHVAKGFTMGMVGCYITHERLMEEIVRNGYGVTIILEDDVMLAEGFADFIAGIHIPHDWDVAFIGWGSIDGQKLKAIDTTWTVPLAGPGRVWGTHCYMVNGKKGAENILKVLHPMTDQVDLMMTQAMKCGKLKGLLLSRPLAVQAGFVSQVQ